MRRLRKAGGRGRDPAVLIRRDDRKVFREPDPGREAGQAGYPLRGQSYPADQQAVRHAVPEGEGQRRFPGGISHRLPAGLRTADEGAAKQLPAFGVQPSGPEHQRPDRRRQIPGRAADAVRPVPGPEPAQILLLRCWGTGGGIPDDRRISKKGRPHQSGDGPISGGAGQRPDPDPV